MSSRDPLSRKVRSLMEKICTRKKYGNSLRLPVEATVEEYAIIEECIEYSMSSPERLWATVRSVMYVMKNNVEGDFVECGVWRGGNAMAMASCLVKLERYERKIYLFDTFNGMTEPGPEDRDNKGRYAADILLESDTEDSSSIWCKSSIEEVAKNMKKTTYPENMVNYVVGDVCNTLEEAENLPSKISILRLDTDWYGSTMKELEVLFPRLAKGGVCIIDDYGHWGGARMAVDEYLAKNNMSPLMHCIDYTGRMFINF